MPIGAGICGHALLRAAEAARHAGRPVGEDELRDAQAVVGGDGARESVLGRAAVQKGDLVVDGHRRE
jgi:nucleotide-binding universal stress UspA family protein